MTSPSNKSPYDKKSSLEFIERLKSHDSELLSEYKSKYERESHFESFAESNLESIVAHFRPVLVIRDNRIVPEFIGPEVEVWKNRLMDKETVLNRVIPSIGRIEVNNNAQYNWVGTGWLVDTDIIVTNRHVASKFCQNRTGFAFKIGYPDGFQSARLDFLEEDQRNNTFEFDIDSVLWMAENDGVQPDIAFLRLKHSLNGPMLPTPIPLATVINEGEIAVTIGYPARDPDFPDQDLVMSVFKNVYEKKRIAPGEIKKISVSELEHDCSTLGGNSGSAVISLATGEALGLHFGGIYMRANYAVPATTIKELLVQLKNKTLPGMKGNESSKSNNMLSKMSNKVIANSSSSYTLELNIPIKITLDISGEIKDVRFQGLAKNNSTTADSIITAEQALEAARQYLSQKPWSEEVRRIRLGYRFRQGWITDEKAIIVYMREKQEVVNLPQFTKAIIPSEFLGIGVEIRSADLFDQLEDLNINLKEEAVPNPGRYIEPPHLKLEAVNEKMDAIFHVSPDSGFPNLREFINRIKKSLTATIYEWDVNHISTALFDAIDSSNGKLKMVTQKTGTQDAVEDMHQRLRDQFEHQWASVGSGKLIPRAYHIKVASRDREEFWLSSGNWKDSNQADIDPAGEHSTAITPLRNHNREWHAIIKNQKLASLFEDYINWDFDESQRVPLEESLLPQPIWLIVKEDITEARVIAKYFDPLIIEDRKLNIQPLLTPDRDDRGRRIFIEFATALIQNAQSTICIENQSFALLDDNNEAFERFFMTLKKKQEDGLLVQIIFRDAQEFHNSNMATIERLKDLGIQTDAIKVQRKCHTKAIIVDPEDDSKAAVLFGSHNLTNTGALFNRDASLLVRDAEVTRYFKTIFDYDWNNLAKQEIEESIVPIRIGRADENPPAGFKKVLLNTILDTI